MTTQFHLILPDFSRRAVLLLQDKDGSVLLPTFNQDVVVRYNTVTNINAAISEQWKLRTTVSRCVLEGDERSAPIFAMHNHDERWQPTLPNADWFELGRLEKLNFANQEHQRYLLEWVESLKDPSWVHVPWSSPDWNAKACLWIEDCVKASGASLLSAPQQVRSWAISAVIKVDTSAGTLYFKAVPDFFGHAPVIEKYLGEQFPQYLIDIVAIEENEHWMLSKEWAGENPSTIEHWKQILKVVTEIQLHCKDNIDQLLSFGCRDRRLSKLSELMIPILEDLADEKMLEIYGIDKNEASELSQRLQRVPSLCEQLASFGLPETLIHGDLWGNNIIVRDSFSGKSPVIFDWTDASITHPFIDIYLLITSEPDVEKRPLIREVFVESWSKHYSRRLVEQALAVAEQLAPFYFVCAFRVVQLNAPEQSRWELAFLFKRFVRNILLA